MARSLNDLARGVSNELNLVGVDQPIANHDAAQIKQIYADLLREWRVQNMAYWDEADIPEEVFRPVVKLVAAEHPRGVRKGYSAGGAAARLRVMARKAASGEPTLMQYF